MSLESLEKVFTVDRTTSLMESRPFQNIVLWVVALIAFFSPLHLSLLEGTEGLYALIARAMASSQEAFNLTLEGNSYFMKPPLFFWFLALSTSLFGENEFALRLPGALFSVGTMVLTFSLGKSLFSRTAGFWAALVVPTTYVFLWYGPRVLMDSGLTFFVTLAIFAWARAVLLGGTPWWYALGFLAMAVGTMLKSIHAFALPPLLLVVYCTVLRDFRPFRQPLFWGGLILSVLLIRWYAFTLGSQFAWMFDLTAGLYRVLGRSQQFGQVMYASDHPIYWYLAVMWFDFFPWCALIVAGMAVLISRRPFRDHRAELFVLCWLVSFFVAFSVAQLKREPYLMPLVPPLGLMVGYYYHAAFSSSGRYLAVPWLKLGITVVAGGVAVMLFLGPSMLATRWNADVAPFPTLFIVTILGICAGLAYAVVRSSMRATLTMFAVLSLGFIVGYVSLIRPTIEEAAGVKRTSEDVKAFTKTSPHPLVLYDSGWPPNEDLVWYLTLEPGLAKVETEDELVERTRAAEQVIVATFKKWLPPLRQRQELELTVIREFQQPRKKNLLLLAVRLKEQSRSASSLLLGKNVQ